MNDLSRERKYKISKMILAKTNDVEISKSQFETLTKSREVLNELTAFEEMYFCICENYAEFELTAHQQSLASLIYTAIDTNEFYESKSQFNRRLSSFLSSVRLYLDTIGVHARTILQICNSKELVRGVLGKQYEESSHYRVLEAVRNHSQHVDQPVHLLGYNSHYNLQEDTYTYGVNLFFKYEYAHLDPKFNPRALADLAELPDGFDLRAGAKIYFSNLATIHAEFREMFDDSYAKAVFGLKEMKDRWLEANSNFTPLGVAAVEYFETPDLTNNSHVYLEISQDEYTKNLRAKTLHQKNMSKRKIKP